MKANFITSKVSRKVALMCILLAVFICAGCCIAGYIEFRNSIYDSYNSFAYELDEIARSYVNGDKITSYLETGETDEEYEEMAQNIYQLYKHSSLYNNKSGIYICIPDAEKLTITNLFDVRIIEAPEEYKQYYAIGCEDPMGIEHPEHAISVFETGEKSDDLFIHETKFGYNSSAMLPVLNSEGTPVALIVTDMPIPYVTEKLEIFLLITVCLTVLIVALFMGGFLAFIQRMISRPLKTIATEAKAFSKSDIQLSKVLPTIKKSDEIGQLADSIYNMEVDIQNYVDNLTAVTAEKERIGAELDVATHIQASMLPCIFPAFPDRREIDIYATMNPAKEVGGDFYDFFMIDDKHIAIVMADVSGKGVPAALFMVIGKTLIKDHTQLNKSLSDVFTEVNNLLCESNSEGLFITAFEGVLDLETGEFNFVNAGHEMPFIYRKGEGYTPEKIRPGFVLAGMEDMKYRGGSIMLNEGDKIFQYTDGVTEATDANNELFGMDRLQSALDKCVEYTPEDTLRSVKADIDAFVGAAPQFDDITMLCLEFKEKYIENKENKEQA